MERLEPCLRRLTDIIAMEKNQDTGEYEVKFNDLWQPTANDKAQTRWLHAQTDEKNILNGLYSAEEARTCRFEQPDYGDDISGLDTLMDDDNYDGDDENDLKPIDTNAGGVPTAGNPNQDAKATPGVNTGISVQAAGAGTGFAAFGMQQG